MIRLLSTFVLFWNLTVSSSAVETTRTTTPSQAFVGASEPTTAQEIYGQDVRSTPWRSPTDELSGFHLPPGFVAELVASEPDIAKPLNMAFDHRGRLWVTCTLEYPIPANSETEGRDSIKILEDTNGDGNMDSVKTFAGGLNIPIGLLPVADGAFCFSIPNIWHLRDIDGDDRADEQIKLLGPFDTSRDTHGMISSLRLGSDGWVYACHGFANRSDVSASDGSRVEMNSGNTFRFLPDGSRVELYTHGQVNPFGMTRDEWGNWYTADCHSKPLTALLPGACYPSFSRPHDGLGFAPSMMEHLHGSTAISGVEYYQAPQFPRAYQHLFYSGNVMTCRINCNRPIRNGMTVRAEEMPDFLTSDDPWFRPVDLQTGPDGCLYIADFYNGIIGHYEVPLDHPDRDRHSGRIWRIRYVGGDVETLDSPTTKPQAAGNWNGLSSKNVALRRQAIAAERIAGSRTLEELVLWAESDSVPVELRLSSIEILNHRRQLSEPLQQSLLSLGPAEVQVLILKLACGRVAAFEWPQPFVEAVVRQSTSSHPEVAKAAFEFLARWGEADHLFPLVELALQTDSADPVRLLAIRIACRNILARNESLPQQLAHSWANPTGVEWEAGEPPPRESVNSQESQFLAELLPGIPSVTAAKALLLYIAGAKPATTHALTSTAIEHAARNPSSDLMDVLVDVLDQATKEDLQQRVHRVLQIADSFHWNRRSPNHSFARLSSDTMIALLDELQRRMLEEGPSITWLDGSGNPWEIEERTCQDGQTASLMSSLTRGERYIGTLASEPFRCPEELSFWCAGHNGFPNEIDHRRNRVQLIKVRTGQILAEAFPPRSDVGSLISWSLSEHAGQDVQLQVIDGDNANAFAWLAMGRFSLADLQPGSAGKLLDAVNELIRRGLGAPENGFAKASELAHRLPLSHGQRARWLAAILEGNGKHMQAALARHAMTVGRPDLVTQDLLELNSHLPQPPDNHTNTIIGGLTEELCRSSTGAQQSVLSRELLKTTEGCELLDDLLAKGLINIGSLRGASTILPAALDPQRRERLQELLSAAEQAGLDLSLVTERIRNLDWSVADAVRGHQVFKQHCANCHQLGGEGATVGPQLDGAIVRGVPRLAEDILLPNINVDHAFRVTTCLLEDGTIVVGQVVDEDERQIRMIGSDAKPLVVPMEEIVARRLSDQSLMPSNFAELIAPQQFADLLLYLTTAANKNASDKRQ